jgi:eukaryotic-like serine/threonine-protein kinase
MTAAADRHLLFGLLALQTGFIQQAQLVAAFHAWTCDKSRSLAEHLIALGHLDPARRAAVEALAALHVEAQGGNVEKSLAAVPANHSTRASLAALGEPEIEATLARVTRNNHGQATEGDDDPDRTSTLAVGGSSGDGRRFRLLRPHARGGLGEVFVALDAELHREVALKQMLEKHADDPVSRQRFVGEAEITGGLEHPGIVPVYGLGTYGGGRPYYAMRFIQGDSLKEALDAFHQRHHRNSPSPPRGEGARRAGEGAGGTTASRDLELRKLLRRFLDVCNAIDYAHSRGVIHRDLKPANIILGRHGETLVVDWGLAKAVGRADPSVGEQTIAPSSSGSSETMPGSALGTPAYMSPEQAAGDLDRLGPRSDVYSLGATLYCLLTGRPPFEGEDIGGILRRVQAGDFPAPREVDPAQDKALDAICRKAMATKPADRYAGVPALAEDVERWMADEPVTAYPEPWTRTLVRWLTRHRTGVTGVAAAVLAGVVGLVTVLAVQSTANARLSAALASERKAKNDLAASNSELSRSRAAVQARYDLAVDAIKTFHTGVSEDFLLKQEQFKELRDRLLRSAADFYGKLGALLGQETDAAARRALAQSNFELAELMAKVGEKGAALAAHRSVLAAREALAAEPGAEAGLAVDVVRSLTAVAGLLGQSGRTEEALAAYRRSESLLAGLTGSDPAARAALAASRTSLGWFLWGMGPQAEAMAVFKLARADLEALAAAPGASNDARRDLGSTIVGIGSLLWRTGKPAAAQAEYRTALALLQKLADGNPADTQSRLSLAINHNSFGWLLGNTGKLAEAEAEYRAAAALLQKLADDNPAVTEFRGRVAVCYTNLGILLGNTGKLAEAEAVHRKALAIYQRLADDNPAATGYRDSLANSHRELGRVLAREKRFPEAFTALDTGLALCQKLADADPEHNWYATALGETYAFRGGARVRAGQPAEAAADLRRCVEVWARVPKLPVDAGFERVRVLALLAGLGKDPRSGVTAAEAASFADRSVAALRDAIDARWAVREELKAQEFDPLRGREDFKKLVAELEAKSRPEAKPKD